MPRPLQCRRFDLHASNQCLDGFLKAAAGLFFAHRRCLLPHRSSPHGRRDHGQRNWMEGRAARAATGPWPWRQASREPWREPRWWRPELVAATHPWTPRTSWTAWREQPCWCPYALDRGTAISISSVFSFSTLDARARAC
jgi:hypothetical protein